MKNKLFTKAFEYSVRGYSIIPIQSSNKIPYIKSWKSYQKDPASDSQIEAWWKKNPKANIGIITGKISGITVVDIDKKKGQASTPLSAFPETYTVRTPSGGYHLYYEYNKEAEQTANTFPHLFLAIFDFPGLARETLGRFRLDKTSVSQVLNELKQGNIR